MYVCCCAAVKSSEIEQRIEEGASIEELQSELGVACGCCCCMSTLEEMMQDKYPYEPASTNQ